MEERGISISMGYNLSSVGCYCGLKSVNEHDGAVDWPLSNGFPRGVVHVLYCLTIRIILLQPI